ncbi:MAG: peptide deformylase [Coriobacteriaceae bacterium]|nr:peptide deformylase [Coriobacteriaceae bacterium]
MVAKHEMRLVALRGRWYEMNIVLAPNPLLRQVCDPCQRGDKSLKRLSKQMAKIMYKSNGCGLAAPQVGVLQRKNPITLVNPEVVETWGEVLTEKEGCLSIPGISVPIARPRFARVRYYDLDGEECMIEGDGLLGRCLQHETDHLDGRTMFEAATPMVRMQALRDYEYALAHGAKPGDVGDD